MILFLVLIVVLLIGLTAAAVMGKIGGFMADPTSSHSFAGVPDGRLSGGDLVELRFDQALRGYRMDQVDEVIDALSARLHELEAEIASVSVSVDEPSAPAESHDLSGETGALSGEKDDLSGEKDDRSSGSRER